MGGESEIRGEPRRLYQQIADQIRSLIRDGTFQMQARLPAERELAQQLGVSRPSLREALIALEIDGSVEIRMGSGIYVRAAPDQLAEATRLFGDSPSETMQARVIIEGSLIMQACARMTEATLRELNAAIEAMRLAIDDAQDPLVPDRRFHEAIVRQAGNSVLTRIVAQLFDERQNRMSSAISARFEDRDTWMAAILEHEAIHAALRAADPLRAQAAMRAHLYQSAERWTAMR